MAVMCTDLYEENGLTITHGSGSQAQLAGTEKIIHGKVIYQRLHQRSS